MPTLTPTGKALGFAVVSLSWLPVAVVVLTLARGLGLPQEAGHWLPLAVSAPCGMSLALAWLALRRAGRERMAWVALSVLGPLSVLGTLAGGVLGPWGIVGYTAAISLPAWIGYAICRWRRTRRRPPK